MITVEKKFRINKPVADVYKFLSEFSNDAKWQKDLIRSEQTSPGPVGLGTTGVYAQKFLGREMKNDVVVSVYEPPKRFGMKSTSGPVQYEYLTTFEDVGGATQVTLTLKGEAGGFFKVAEPLMKGELEKSFDRDFAKLKEILES